MATQERLISAMQRMHLGGRFWVSDIDLQKCTGIPLEEIRLRLSDLDCDGLIDSSGTTGHMRNRYHLVACKSGDLQARPAAQEQEQEQDQAQAQKAEEDSTAAQPDSSMAAALGFMTNTILANHRDRLVLTASFAASDQMRALPCRAITSDIEDGQFQRRRRDAVKKILRSTGFDLAPAGKVTLVTLNKPGERPALPSDGPVATLREIRDVTRVTRVTRDENNHQLSVNLPRGGIATTNEVSSIEPVGDVLILHLARRVNARSLTFTNESAAHLASSLSLSFIGSDIAADSEINLERKSCLQGGSVLLRDKEAQMLLDRADLARAASCESEPYKQLTINLPKGGSAAVSQIASVYASGPVMTVQLDRLVNAKIIALTRKDAFGFGRDLGSAIGDRLQN